MKTINFILLILLMTYQLVFSQGNIGIGTKTPHVSALLDIDASSSNEKRGLLLPRLTEVERNNISNPAESLLIFNTDTQCCEGYSIQQLKWFSFSCLKDDFICGNSFTDDRDGNIYNTVQIDDKCWMAENLKFLPSVNNDSSPTEPRYYVYGYKNSNLSLDDAKIYEENGTPSYATYGVLYNWAAVMQHEASSNKKPSGVKGVCPIGWYVPSDAEWCEMENYVEQGIIGCNRGLMGGLNVGIRLKTSIWGGDNSSGFTALPGGFRNPVSGEFYGAGNQGDGAWYSSTEVDVTSGATAYYRSVSSDEDGINRSGRLKGYAFSVRCIKK